MFSPSGQLYRIDQVPDHFKELFIISGYRSPKSSPKQCVLSIFSATNETLNFWTHFLPAVYFWYKTYELCTQHDLLQSSYMLPMLAYMLCLCTFPLTSAVAHLFNCVSDTARHTCFFLDYAALSLYSLGAAISYHAYVCSDAFLSSSFAAVYLPVAVVNTFLSLILSCETRFMVSGPWKKCFRFVAYALPYFFDCIPVFLRIFSSSLGELVTGAMYLHVRQFAFAGMAAFVYTTHLPERLYPGSFDIVGHSHQLFHICTVLGSNDQMHAIIRDLTHRKHQLQANGHIPSAQSSLLLMLAVMCITSVILIYFIRKLHLFKRLGKPMSRCGSFLDAMQFKLMATDGQAMANGASMIGPGGDYKFAKKRH